jgi:hypothetical protein
MPEAEHRLKLSENRALRGTFGPERNEVILGWRQMDLVEIHRLYSSPSLVGMAK